MTLALVGTILALIAVLGGLSLATLFFSRKSAPRWLLWGHPSVGTVALICLWVAFSLWPGSRVLPLDAGIIVVTLAFSAGGFMFSLRVTRIPIPAFAIIVHGLAALGGCALLIVGLLHAFSAELG